MPSFLVTVLPVLTNTMNVIREITKNAAPTRNVEKCACIGEIRATIPRINVELNAKLPRRSPTAMLL